MATVSSFNTPATGMPQSVIKIEANAETSQPVFVPNGNVGLELKIVSGTARFEQTSADPDSIAQGANVWFPWIDGDVAISTSSLVFGATAVRVVATNSVVAYVRC